MAVRCGGASGGGVVGASGARVAAMVYATAALGAGIPDAQLHTDGLTGQVEAAAATRRAATGNGGQQQHRVQQGHRPGSGSGAGADAGAGAGAGAGATAEHPQWLEAGISHAKPLDIRSTAGVHHDPQNLPLFRAAAARVAESVATRLGGSAGAAAPELRVLDLGSGSGVWGLLLTSHLRHAIGLEDCSIHLSFADVSEASVALSLENAARNHGTLGAGHANKAFSFDGFVGDMFDAVASNSARSNNRSVGGAQVLLRESRPFDVILFNPPQTGGNEAFGSSRFRLEKYGGEDGSLFYRRFGTRPTCIAAYCLMLLLHNAVDHSSPLQIAHMCTENVLNSP
jgi:hypothetical protein